MQRIIIKLLVVRFCTDCEVKQKKGAKRRYFRQLHSMRSANRGLATPDIAELFEREI